VFAECLCEGLFIVFANLPPTSGKEGITAFLVEKNDGGVAVGNKEDKVYRINILKLNLSEHIDGNESM
jgi:alkylation response protein AidB-like acyl-CoA dehydrogenase